MKFNRFCFWSLTFFYATLMVLRADDKAAQEFLAQAEKAYRKGDQAEAIRLANQASEAAPNNPKVFYARGSLFGDMGEHAKAIADYDKVLKMDPETTAVYQRRGSEHFKLGHIKESIADFDAFLKRVPAQEPYHWQRGISYYYAGQFTEGRRQFEIHQTVNRNDVENAVWHFLCTARESGLEKAREILIPIKGDSRVPMKQVHELFAQKIKPAAVLEAAMEGKASKEGRQRHLFYAHLYLGLYYEALQDEALARTHIFKAAELSVDQGYMGDVARVHAQRLGQAVGSKAQE